MKYQKKVAALSLNHVSRPATAAGSKNMFHFDRQKIVRGVYCTTKAVLTVQLQNLYVIKGFEKFTYLYSSVLAIFIICIARRRRLLFPALSKIYCSVQNPLFSAGLTLTNCTLQGNPCIWADLDIVSQMKFNTLFWKQQVFLNQCLNSTHQQAHWY